MKGMVFTEFLELVEEKFGFDVADALIEENDLKSGGIFTSVGTYSHTDLVQMVITLSEKTKIPVPDLIKIFGTHLFGRFSILYPQFFTESSDAFSFLKNIDGYIHVEVRKLYPDAGLPKFTHEEPDTKTLILIYDSPRPFADLAEGLIAGCIAHFGEKISIEREKNVDTSDPKIRFVLKKN